MGDGEHLGALAGRGLNDLIGGEFVRDLGILVCLVCPGNWRKSWSKMEGFEGMKCTRGEGNRCLDC